MKVLTAGEMREVDRRTRELGVPGLILMENAGHRVVEFLLERFSPLDRQRIVVLCGKGNNGGDGLVVARQLFTRCRPRSLDVVLAGERDSLVGDARDNLRMLAACGCPAADRITAGMRRATIVVDALLGTGLEGPPRGRMLEMIREINQGFPEARVVAVDIPSGVSSDSAASAGETVRAGYTVTFTAPKAGHVLPPNCDLSGELRVAPIGSPPALWEDDPSIWLYLAQAGDFRSLFQPRPPGAHKGHFGHVLVVAGSRRMTGAAAMTAAAAATGMAALRAGAGLVTVASAESAIPLIAAHAPELMTEPLVETAAGAISRSAGDRLEALLEGKSVLALGPGLGADPETVEVVSRLVDRATLPVVADADALNAIAGRQFQGRPELVLTPHPGEMGRLMGRDTAVAEEDRLEVARDFAMKHRLTLVLKGRRTLTAYADGRVWVNPTGTPAMATGGAGDILTGLIAGFLAQFPGNRETALRAAVWLHGRAGELGAAAIGEKALVATDLLGYLPRAMEECAAVSDRL